MKTLQQLASLPEAWLVVTTLSGLISTLGPQGLLHFGPFNTMSLRAVLAKNAEEAALQHFVASSPQGTLDMQPFG